MQKNKRVEHPTLSEILQKKLKPTTDEFTTIQQASSVHQEQFIIPSYNEMIKNPPENPTTITLNRTEYRKWNVEQVASLLIADNSIGGCDFSVEKVKPLVDDGFDGVSLHIIVNDLLENVDPKIGLERIYNKHDSPQLSSTIQSLVFWVKNDLIRFEKLKETSKPSEATEESKSQSLKEFISSFYDGSNIRNYEQSSIVLLGSFGKSFPFIDRQEPVKQIKSVYNNRKSLIQDKSEVVIPYIAAAPGVGKSRLLKEVGLELFSSNNCIPLYISFGNGTSMKSSEMNIVDSLIIRIIYSFIKSSNNSINFSKLLEKWNFYNFVDTDLLQVFNSISEILQLPNASFYLAIDEAQDIDTGTNDKLTNPLILLSRYIGSYIMENNNHVLYPLIGGTYHVGIRDGLSGSTFTAQFIPIGATLPYDQMSEIFDELQTEYPINMENWRTNVEFRNYTRSFSGYPRGIEFFLENYLTNYGASLESAWRSSKEKIYKYVSSNNTLIRYILTRREVIKTDKVKGTDKTFSQLENMGYIMFDPTTVNDYFIPTYPAVLLQVMIPKHLRDEFENLFFKQPQLNKYGLNWEEDLQHYMYLFLSMLSGENGVTLKELFPTAKMNNTTSIFTIHDIPVKIYKESYQLQGKLTGQTTNEIELLKKCYVIKNAESGDILIIGLQSNDKEQRILIHLQCKWADKYKSSLPYSAILEEYKTNNLIEIVNENVLNITVIVAGQQITDIPKELPDYLIIIDSSNFSSYFGIFADQMQLLHATQMLYINEFNLHQLQSFPAIGKENANEIIEARNNSQGGFKDNDHLCSCLESPPLVNTLKEISHSLLDSTHLVDWPSTTIMISDRCQLYK